MNTSISKFGALLLRVSFSISLIMIHGLEKLMMVINGQHDFPDPLGVGSLPTLLYLIFSELVCPIFIIFGFKVRFFVIPILVAMLIALLIYHAGDSFADRELAYVYLFAYARIYLAGSDKHSLDFYLSQRRTK